MLFWNYGKARNHDGISELVRSPYSMLKLTGYRIPEQMLTEIEEEAKKIVADAISNNLIDKFTVEEMQNENHEDAHFIDKIIHHKFIKPLNELKRQRIVIERETIESIRMLQRAELYKEKKELEFAKCELEQCKCIKAHI